MWSDSTPPAGARPVVHSYDTATTRAEFVMLGILFSAVFALTLFGIVKRVLLFAGVQRSSSCKLNG